MCPKKMHITFINRYFHNMRILCFAIYIAERIVEMLTYRVVVVVTKRYIRSTNRDIQYRKRLAY